MRETNNTRVPTSCGLTWKKCIVRPKLKKEELIPRHYYCCCCSHSCALLLCNGVQLLGANKCCCQAKQTQIVERLEDGQLDPVQKEYSQHGKDQTMEYEAKYEAHGATWAITKVEANHQQAKKKKYEWSNHCNGETGGYCNGCSLFWYVEAVNNLLLQSIELCFLLLVTSSFRLSELKCYGTNVPHYR